MTAEKDRLRAKVGPKRRETMNAFLALRKQGLSIDEATAKLGRTKEAYKQWRKVDPAFANEHDRIVGRLKTNYAPPPCPFTPEMRTFLFWRDYWYDPLNPFLEQMPEPDLSDPVQFFIVHNWVNPPHLLIALDFINSLKGGQFGLITFPPEHAKTSIMEDWLTCAPLDDSETREAVISKNKDEASKRLGKVKGRYEDRDFYPEVEDLWGPLVGKPWGATKFSLARKTPRQRDYTMQASGIGVAVQGRRIDKLGVDDPEDDQNFQEYLSHARYVRQSLNTRLGKRGVGLMIGTRQDEMDLYRHLEDEGFFDKILKMPAVFEEDTDYPLSDGRVVRFKAGDTLWPTRYSPVDYDRMRRKAGPRIWALVYQQESVVSEGQAFPLELFEHCYNPHRRAQEVPAGEGTVAGMDPGASSGYTALHGLSVNSQTKLRTWIDAWSEKGLVGDGGDILPGLRQFLLEFVDEYNVRLLCLEANSAFTLFSTNLTLRQELTDRGCTLMIVESTGAGLRTRGSTDKSMEDLSIKALSTVFSNGMHSIPTGAGSLKVFQPVIHQFMGWRLENKRYVKDRIKACQFAEAAARRFLKGFDSEAYGDSSDHLSPALKAKQIRVPIGSDQETVDRLRRLGLVPA